MSDSSSSNINMLWVFVILIGIVLFVVGLYFFNFNSGIVKIRIGLTFLRICPKILEVGGHLAIMLAEYLIRLLPPLRFT
jgi:hypothetical protein